MIKFSLLFELINHLTRLTEPFTPLINKTMQVLELVPKCSGFLKGEGGSGNDNSKAREEERKENQDEFR